MKHLWLLFNILVPLQWDTGINEPQDAGYRLQWTDANGQRAGSFDAGTNVSAEIDLAPGRWKVTVIAYNADAMSSPSNEFAVAVAHVEIQSSDDQRTWTAVGPTDALLVGQKFFRGNISVP